MKTTLLTLVSLLLIATALYASEPIVPSHYLSGPISRDVDAALKRAQTEHRPIWIIAWDEKFQLSPEGKKTNTTDYPLHYFYQNPEAKKLVADHFIQVFTTMNNKAIEQWIDKGDVSHEPVYIVLDANGNLIAKKKHYANPGTGLQEVQAIVAALK